MEAIVAISTALSPAGIAVIRMSGEHCTDIAARLFRTSVPFDKIEPRKMMLGTLVCAVSEKCLTVFFPAPHSYTGEDVVEFQIHGGVTVAQIVLDACIAQGARLATAGEFTKRAFLNGKMTLAQAEGTIDTINATSEAELRAGYHLVSGGLSQKISGIRSSLLDAISAIEVHIDYPEEDLDEVTRAETDRAVKTAADKVDALLATRRQGLIVKEGLNVALLGKPNVGKSSLLNCLLGVNRAIVTAVAGTTRDHIDATVLFRGVKLNLIDTAGLRESFDPIESVGIDDAKRIARACDLAVVVVDNTFGAEDRAILDSITVPKIIVQNKADLKKPIKIADLHVCAKTGDGIERLKERLYSAYLDERTVVGGEILTNARHADALTAARAALARALDAPSLDLIPVDLREAVAALGKIDGATVSRDVTDDIFSKFCLGK